MTIANLLIVVIVISTRAVDTGKRVRKMRNNHQTVIKHFEDTQNALQKVCFTGDIESVKRIIEDGKIDVNFSSSISYGDSEDLNIEQATLLFVASSMGHVEIVRYLVEIAGADISAKVSGVLIPLSTDSLWEWGLDGVTPLYAFLERRDDPNIIRTHFYDGPVAFA